MYAYYLHRGHSLQELINLSMTEKLFYKNAMDLGIERVSALIGGDSHGKND